MPACITFSLHFCDRRQPFDFAGQTRDGITHKRTNFERIAGKYPSNSCGKDLGIIDFSAAEATEEKLRQLRRFCQFET